MTESGQTPEPRLPSPTAPHPVNTMDFEKELRFQRALLLASVTSLLLLSFALNAYLFRQVSMIRKELDASSAALKEYETKRAPLINSFVAGLQTFARTHPDFSPVLERYGIGPATTPPSLTPLAPQSGGQ